MGFSVDFNFTGKHFESSELSNIGILMSITFDD